MPPLNDNGKKILWVAHRDPLNPKAGGAERTIQEVCSRLVKRGNSITLLSGGFKGCKPVDDLKGIRIYRYGGPVGPHFALPVFLLKNNYDVVVNDLGHAVPWLSSTILGKKNITFFRHLHARSLPGQVSPLIARLLTAIEKCYFIIHFNSIFVTESSTAKSDLSTLGIRENRIFTIPPGVDGKLFAPGPKTTYPSIIYFGGMRKYKRPQECIFLMQNIVEKLPNIKLFIVGSGPEESNLRNLTRVLKLEAFINFMGKATDEDLSKIVSSSWLNIHSSVTEGWGLSILEASASGTPTVAYRVPGVEDVIEHGVNGLKVSNGDRASLVEASLSILYHPERWWRSTMEVAKKYSWEETVQRWEQMLEEIMKDGKYNPTKRGIQ